MSDTLTVEEKYAGAITTSNLRVQADKSGAGDVIIAVGWSASRIGAALMRMHTKADRDTLGQLHAHITKQAEHYGIDRPVVVAASVLSWWFFHVCQVCKGVRFELVANTPSLSSRQCKACRGSGEVAIPHGEAGKRLAAWLDQCKESGAQSIRARLHNIRN